MCICNILENTKMSFVTFYSMHSKWFKYNIILSKYFQP